MNIMENRLNIMDETQKVLVKKYKQNTDVIQIILYIFIYSTLRMDFILGLYCPYLMAKISVF